MFHYLFTFLFTVSYLMRLLGIAFPLTQHPTDPLPPIPSAETTEPREAFAQAFQVARSREVNYHRTYNVARNSYNCFSLSYFQSWQLDAINSSYYQLVPITESGYFQLFPISSNCFDSLLVSKDKFLDQNYLNPSELYFLFLLKNDRLNLSESEHFRWIQKRYSPFKCHLNPSESEFFRWIQKMYTRLQIMSYEIFLQNTTGFHADTASIHFN